VAVLAAGAYWWRVDTLAPLILLAPCVPAPRLAAAMLALLVPQPAWRIAGLVSAITIQRSDERQARFCLFGGFIFDW
jgi:hypothetical protein